MSLERPNSRSAWWKSYKPPVAASELAKKIMKNEINRYVETRREAHRIMQLAKANGATWREDDRDN